MSENTPIDEAVKPCEIDNKSAMASHASKRGMKLLFATRAIDRAAGGLERMIISIMNAMAERGHDVSLLSWDGAAATAFYPMSPDVTWRRLDMGDHGSKAGMGQIAARLPVIRGLVKGLSPDVIVCFEGGSFRAMQLYTAGLGIPLVAALRTAPTLYDHNWRLRFIECQAFRFARRIAVQFERYRDLYPAYLRPRIVTVPNPVAEARVLARPDVPAGNGRFRLLSVGRLNYQKNYAVLIEAFARLAPRFPDWDLRIVGEGEDRNELEAHVFRLPELAGRVALPGTTAEVDTEYAAAHLFCLPSRWEGFPNALAEALAHGLPAVGFLGCAGVPDLIDAGGTGALAAGNGDASALADALASLMAEADRRAAMGRAAVASVAAYRPEAMFDLWEATLRECIAGDVPGGTNAGK
jgi:glycosyltransferase involved in cell wall biosynthesis